jgi:hypothetical protein
MNMASGKATARHFLPNPRRFAVPAGGPAASDAGDADVPISRWEGSGASGG